MDQRKDFAELRFSISDTDPIAVEFKARRIARDEMSSHGTRNTFRVPACGFSLAIRAMPGFGDPQVNAICQIHGRFHKMAATHRESFRDITNSDHSPNDCSSQPG